MECFHFDNGSYRNESVKYMQIGLISFSFSLTLGFIGIVNNILLLIMFYRLKWMKKRKVILFLNLAIVDLLVCLSAFTDSLFSIVKYIKFKTDVEKQIECVETFIWFYLLCIISGRIALCIAIDRLLMSYFLYRKFVYEKHIKYAAVAANWVGQIIYETFYVSKIPNDKCVIACLGYVSFPKTTMFKATTILNNVLSGLIIISYVLIPLLAKFRIAYSFIHVRKQNTVLGNASDLKKHQHEFLARIRLMSSVYITGYVLCMAPAVLLCNLMGFDTEFDLHADTIMWAISDVMLVINSTMPLYIWLLFDKTLQKQFLSTFRKSESISSAKC